MARRNRTRGPRRLSRGIVIGAACLLSACGRDALVDAAGRARPPEAPAQLVNPVCSGGGLFQGPHTISTAVTWQASGNPHLIDGTVTIAPGGTLTIEPGAIVCFNGVGRLHSTGGRLVARGLPASPVLLTAYDPPLGWLGITLEGTPPSGSQIAHARVEHVRTQSTAIVSTGHLVFIDSSVVRRSGAGVSLSGANSRFGWSRVDTTTNRNVPAVTLGDNARFQQSVIRRAAGVGMLINGTTGVRLIDGGRIEGSGGIGIRAPNLTGIAASSLVRVVGGQSYPIETTVPLLQRLYGSTAANQDSLKGNARDTLVMLGGSLNALLYVRMGLPWHVKVGFNVLAGGVLAAQASSALVMDSAAFIAAGGGGRVSLRGTRTSPVVLTADDPALGWNGIFLFGAPAQPSYVTNAVVEHVTFGNIAVQAIQDHAVRVDSVVLRQNGAAVGLYSPGSRLTRSRVDTTTTWYLPAVDLSADAILESTLVRGSSHVGVWIGSPAVQVQSCEVRESVMDGIYIPSDSVAIHNCNLVDNGWWGIASTTFSIDVTNNWWGDPAGPFGPNGDGADAGDVYTPWRTTPFVLPYVP